MNSKKILSKVISLVLCAVVLLGSFTTAYGNTEADTNSQIIYNKNTTFADISGSFIESLFSNGKSQIQSKGAVLEVVPPFIIVPLHTQASLFSSIESWVFVRSNVTVLGYEGFYTKVRVNNTEKEGYIFKFFLSSDEDFLIKQFENVYVGKSKKILKDYNNPEDFSWSVSQDGIISLNKQTGEIKGLKPGTVIVTAKHGNSTDKCIVSSINQWKETESSSATKDIVVKSNPDSSDYDNFTKGTIPSGAAIVARGDMADGSGWIYVSDKAEKVWGFIKLSDFSGIEYLFTEYHYYDQGYNIRFGSAENKIYTYASVMNDIMMDLFKLKINPYVYSYTSPADQCKILRYGSVKTNNLASSCPKNGNHKDESCLTSKALRDNLQNTFGAGNEYIAKTAWTGHIMDKNAMSNSQRNPSFILIFTTGNTVNKSTYQNKSASVIRSRSIYELIHKTSHQFGLHDHYCKKNGSPCTNQYCYSCTRGYSAPRCIMNLPFDTENYNNDELFCDECLDNIKTHLNDHH